MIRAGDGPILGSLLVTMLFLAGCVHGPATESGRTSSARAGEPVDWRVLHDGKGTDFPGEGSLVARDAETFERIWRLHSIDASVPEVDFTKELVVALFAGRRPDTCHDIEVTGKATPEGEAGRIAVVEVERVVPTAESGCARAVTTPYQFVAIGRADHVLFEFQVAQRTV